MNKKARLLLAALVCLSLPVAGQTLPFLPTPPAELPDPHPAPAEVWDGVARTTLGWGSTDVRYAKHDVPSLAGKQELWAWRGERVQAQAVLLCPRGVSDLTVTMSDLTCGKATIPATSVAVHLVRYTMADRGEKGKDSCLVADALLPMQSVTCGERSVQPLWFDIAIPQQAKAGTYKATLTAVADGQTMALPLTIHVSRHVLPDPKEWAFHLDLWQNPYAVARYYDVPLWSDEHFALMRPTMQLLASAGQKVITCSVIQHPWNSQTEDPFESMIGKRRAISGEWTYDYRVFDRWVEFMMDCGITEQIDCYTLLPWHLTFEYYDEARNATVLLHLQPGTPEYEAYLLPFLTDFARHLRQKGWFHKTCIAMDERPKSQLEPAYEVIRAADAEYRVEGAINYFGPEVAERMYDISFNYEHPLLERDLLESHLAKGRRVTFYTCCGPFRPNTFTFSSPAESAFMGWHAAAAGYSGYLRWAYNSWVKSPWQDSRFRTWLSGDCFLVYPGGSSIRMQRLIEGIQDYEKIRLLRRDLPPARLRRLEEVVAKCAPTVIAPDFDMEALMHEAKAALREL